MARLAKQALFYTQPKRPEPINLAIRHVIDWHHLQFLKQEPDLLAERVKSYMVQKLSAELMKRLQPFIVESMCKEGQAYQVEVMLSDRGSYERWLPQERGLGRIEGVKSAIASLPYGMNPNEFFE